MKVPGTGTCQNWNRKMQIWDDVQIYLSRGTIEGQEGLAREGVDMEQLMEKPIEMLKSGPRHARPVTLKGRLRWALDKGPTKWGWKTYMAAMAFVVAIIVIIGVVLALGMIAVLKSFE